MRSYIQSSVPTGWSRQRGYRDAVPRGFPGAAHRPFDFTRGSVLKARGPPRERSTRPGCALAPGSILIAVAALLQDLLPAEALALPRRYPWPAHHPERRGARVPGGASTLPHRQTDNASFFEARLRGTSAGAGHRCAHHPTAAGASEPSHHGSLLCALPPARSAPLPVPLTCSRSLSLLSRNLVTRSLLLAVL